MSVAWTRRAFLRRAALSGAAVLAACADGRVTELREKARRLGAGLDCSDVVGLQPAEARTREENAYRQHTDKADQFCLDCLNFVPADDETRCGTCKTVRGPINPDGWCRQWTKLRS